MRFKALFVACVTLGLVGCGPVMQTHYQFTPPKSESGRTCLVSCESARQSCVQMEEMKYQLCEERADRDYYECQRWEAVEDIRRGKEKKWYEGSCYRQSCTANVEYCDTNYRICYQNCGGTVISETVCVSNCEELK